MVASGEEDKGMGKKGDGGEEVPTASYKLNKLQDIMYTTGNRVNNIVITLYGDR